MYKDKYSNTNETPLKFWNTLTKKWNTLETPFRGKEKDSIYLGWSQTWLIALILRTAIYYRP